MATLPSATVRVDDTAAALPTGTDLLAILAPVATAADAVPRMYSSVAALLAKHGYAPGVDYAALHLQETGLPVLFCGLPIATAGSVGRVDDSGVAGSCTISVAPGGSGALEECDLVLQVTAGGTVGTAIIKFDLSLDGGRTFKSVRLGTANSYTIPYVGLVISFGGGTLNVGDEFLCKSSGPLADDAGYTAAREALATQQRQERSWLLIGDLQDGDEADDIVTQVNAYETTNDKFSLVRAQLRDRLPAPEMSQSQVRMTGQPSLTFAASGDTITRAAGTWTADGFAVGDVVTITGTDDNELSGAISAINMDGDELTLVASLTDETAANATVVASPGLVFADAGGTGDTITRSRGSWLADGFAAGDLITVDGTNSNDFVGGAVATVVDLVLTMDTQALSAETIASYGVSITGGESDSDWVANIDAEFEDVSDEKRIDLGAGRARKLSPITGYRFRRPVQWAASIREYQHDVQIPCWRKSDGPLSGWDLEDEDGILVEHDERIDGGLLAGRFTCFRTWSNGPKGTYIALSLTRRNENSLLSRTHNMAVTNVACRVCQAETENAVGEVLVLNADGTGSEEALKTIEARVNRALAIALLQPRSEGPRASSARWSASRSDVLNVPGATLTGTLLLNLLGTLEKITTTVRIQTAGA